MESPVPTNPYSAPSANLYGSATSPGADVVSPGTIAALAGTKPWVRFMAVIVWIAIVFMLVGAVGMLIMSMVGPNVGAPASPINMAFGGRAFMMGMAVTYVVIALMYIYPAIKLWSYASNIARLAASHTVADLDAALNEQRRFWKFLGILVIIMISLYAVFFIAMIIVAGMGAINNAGGLR